MSSVRTQNPNHTHRPRLAATINTVKHLLHGQHILDRLLDGYGWNGTYHHPAMDLVSLYVDQRGVGDLSFERAERHPTMKVYPTIMEALTLGTDKLAVDGVVLIAEDENYPDNEKGQKEFPRYPFFEQIVDVFRLSGRSVPVYVDKHLSFRWEWAKQMHDQSKQLCSSQQSILCSRANCAYRRRTWPSTTIPTPNPPFGEPNADPPPIPRLHRSCTRRTAPCPLGSIHTTEIWR